MKDMLNLKLISVQLVVSAFLIAILVDDGMPEQMVTHWNAQGAADGQGSKFVGLWLPPLIMLVVLALAYVIPKIDPRRKNIEKFQGQWDVFVVMMLSFLLYMYGLTVYWNAGSQFNFVRLMAVGLVVVIFGMSRIIAVAKPNYSIGIRTPWTLADDKVWEKTHQLGGKLFMMAALIMVAAVIWPSMAIWIVLISVLVPTLITAVYSYLQFKNLNKSKEV